MSLDPAILASDQYLGLDSGQAAEKAQRLDRTLTAAVARCESYTGRRITPNVAASETVEVWTSTALVRIPDCMRLTAIAVVAPSGVPAIAVDQVELVPFGGAPGGAWLRLPGRPLGRQRLALTGQFGMDPMPADLEDSIYTYAATRWREAEAQFGERVGYTEGGDLVLPRRLPTVVRGVWDEFRIPEPTVGVIPIRPA